MCAFFCYRNFRNSILDLRNWNTWCKAFYWLKLEVLLRVVNRNRSLSLTLFKSPHFIKNLSEWSDVFGAPFSAPSAGSASCRVCVAIYGEMNSHRTTKPTWLQTFLHLLCWKEQGRHWHYCCWISQSDVDDIRIAFSQKSRSAALLGGSQKNLKGFWR